MIDNSLGGIEETETLTTQEIVKFVDDGQVQVSGVASIVPVNTCATSTGKEIRDHTVKDFIKRPVLLSTVEWSSAVLAGAQIVSYDIPNSLLNKPLISEKVSGFTFFRASTVFKIQCNATPFMQGRLIAVFVPYGGKNRRDLTSITHLPGITGYPHVDIDLSTHQTMTLKIPFVSPLTHLNLVRGFGTIGQLKLFVYSPLSSSEASSIQVSTWAWFDDVEVEVPTGMPINVRLQGAEGESDSVAHIQADIPLPWEQISSLGSGFAKPTELQHPMPMQPNLQRSFANGMGFDSSKTFSMAPVAASQPFLGKFGTSRDEMDLGYLTRTPTYFGKFAWNTASAGGALLDSIPVHPMVTDLTDTPANVRFPTLLSYITSAFSYWSGSLVYTFKFVKTNFHSGRLRVVFVPGRVPADTRSVDISKCYTQIFDMREKSEFEMRIPYVNHTPWAAVGRGQDKWNTAPVGTQSIGTILIYVLNELRAPGITSDTIECLKEIKGGTDFSLAAPSFMGAIPVTSAPHAPSLVDSVKLQGFEDIMTRDECQEEVCEPISLFEGSTMDNDVCKDKFCIGERVTNLRTLMKRNQYLTAVSMQAGSAVRVYPYFVNSAKTPTLDGNDRQWNDYFSYFSHIFAFQSGGMRIKMLTENSADRVETYHSQIRINTTTGSQPQTVLAAVTSIPVSDAQYVPFPRSVHFPATEGLIEVEVPQYWRTATMMSGAYLPLVGVVEDPTNVAPVNFEVWCAEQTATPSFRIYRSVADDFNFGFLTGAPRLVINPAV